MLMQFASFGRRLRGAFQRNLAARLACRFRKIRTNRSTISFCFDDFPESSARVAGSILLEHKIRATYYVSFGLAGSQQPTGKMFSLEDVHSLLSEGHEIGCHTYDHSDAWYTKPPAYEESVVRNASALRAHFPGLSFQTHSYPINHPRPGSKFCAQKYFAACRGGGQKANEREIDLNNLSALFLEQVRGRLDLVKHVIDMTLSRNGWLILATHDVCKDPTRFGCTPGFFEEVVLYAATSGASVLPVGAALMDVALPIKNRSEFYPT